MNNEQLMQEAINLAQKGLENNNGGPFGAIIVKNGIIVGRGNNKVTSTNDPTAHAEIVAIRDACQNLKTFNLSDCDIYTSCEPCPMCLGAIYWARIRTIYYGATRYDAQKIGFDDDFIYQELNKSLDKRKIIMKQINQEGAKEIFQQWLEKEDKIKY